MTVRDVGCQTTAPGRELCDRDHTVKFYLSQVATGRGGLSDYSSRQRILSVIGTILSCSIFPSGCQKVGCQTTAPGREFCDRDHTVMFYLSKVAVRKTLAVRLQLQAENFVIGTIQSCSIFPKWLSGRGGLSDYSSRQRTLYVVRTIQPGSTFPK